MNKQELIDELKKLLAIPSKLQGHNYGLRRAIALAKQLDEPEKPVVPQFVADWYEEHKDNFEDGVYDFFVEFYEYEYRRELSADLYWWFKLDVNKPIETFVKMKLFGYEVQKEKLYTVKIPNPNASGYSRIYLAKNKGGKVELFTWSGYTSSEFADNWKQEENAQLTESEIKKDFDWAWQFAEEVEG